MYADDWSDFTADRPWFVKVGDNISVTQAQLATSEIFKPPDEFGSMFPMLTKLLSQARLTIIRANQNEYHLYGWTNEGGKSLGWLCKPPGLRGGYPASRYLHPEHRLLLHSFGGIVERWHEPDTWLLNYNSALTEEDSELGFNGAEDYYRMMCEDEGLPATINPEEYVAFAFEANGNCTIYQKDNAKVLMFAHDHSFDHITPLNGCPELTLYTINGYPDFSTWVEIVADQWLQNTV